MRNSVKKRYIIKNISTNKMKGNIALDFREVNIKVVGWNEDYIQVRNHNYLTSAEVPNILIEKNKIVLLDYKKPNSLRYKIKTFRILDVANEYTPIDFEIRVPKDKVLDIYANFIRALNCTISSAQGKNAYFKECKLGNNFNGRGEYIFMKRCTVCKKYNLNYNNTYLHDSNIIK